MAGLALLPGTCAVNCARFSSQLQGLESRSRLPGDTEGSGGLVDGAEGQELTPLMAGTL